MYPPLFLGTSTTTRRPSSPPLPLLSPSSHRPAPSVPRLMGYCHVGHAVRLGADGVLRVGRSTAEGVSTDVFGEGKAGMEVIQDIVSQVQDQVRARRRGWGRELHSCRRGGVPTGVCRRGGGCKYQPKLNQNQRKRAEHRQRC